MERVLATCEVRSLAIALKLSVIKRDCKGGNISNHPTQNSLLVTEPLICDNMFIITNMATVRIVKLYQIHCTGKYLWDTYKLKKLYSLFNDVDIIKRIKVNRLKWAGHVVRRENEGIIKSIMMLLKPERKRK
jgi:hypothetical protein